ncbi:MAG: histidine kinase [Ignavibacteria bacterium]|nr:histidine kinase [Ignavibacteria bacterium]
MRKTTAYLLCSFIIIINTVSFCGSEEYVFKTFSLEDGLSQSSILAMAQDKIGFLWLATADGLNRYDGYEFKVYRYSPNMKYSLSDNGVSAVYVDRDGILWAGTILGALNKYDSKTERFEHINFSDKFTSEQNNPNENLELIQNYSRRSSGTITSIAEDNNGNLWIGTWGKGIIVYNKKTGAYCNIHHCPENPNSLTHNTIGTLLVENDNLWVGTFGGGLNKLTIPKNIFGSSTKGISKVLSFRAYQHKAGNPTTINNDFIASLYLDKHKNLWIGTYFSGVNVLNNVSQIGLKENITFTSIPLPQTKKTANSQLTVLATTEDTEGYMWIGIFGVGLVRYTPSTGETLLLKNEYYNKSSIASNDVFNLFTDKNGIVWIGTSLSNGVCKMTKSNLKFNSLTHIPENSQSLNDGIVWSVYHSKADEVWIGTYSGGANCYNRKTNQYTFYTHTQGCTNCISSNHIRAITEDRFGNMWFGTFNGGLCRLNRKTGKFTWYQHNNDDAGSIGSNQILNLYIDNGDTLWIASFGGGWNYISLRALLSGRKAIFKKYMHDPENPSSISSNRVYCTMQDHNGIFWVGTFGGGFNKFDRKTGKFTRYQHKNNDALSLSDDRVMSIFEDQNHRMWVGTFGGGLNGFNPENGTFTRYNDRHGLFSNTVYSILEDNHSNLWMSTDNGVFKFEINSQTFVHYDYNDGLQSTEFNGGAYFKSSQGEMFFGGVNGLNYFYPNALKKNKTIPPVVITDFKIFDVSIPGEHIQINLEHNQNFITFQFASLDYYNPGAHRYAYFLEGFDKVWHYTDAKYRLAHYTNLPHGTYVFHVKGTNNDGVWNEDGASVTLIIAPPFYLRWWFLLISLLAIMAPTYLVMRFRLDKIKSIEALRQRLSADIHDNLGANLTEISILSELMAQEVRDSAPAARDKAGTIARTARKLIDDFSDTIWTINPNRDTLYDLLSRIKSAHEELFSFTGINFSIENFDSLQKIKLNNDYRQNLYLIIKEGINNCVKHSQCQNIELKISIRKDIIHIALKDDGKGFSTMQKRPGFGLQNMNSRAKLIGGKVHFYAIPEGGTLMTFVGRINNKVTLYTYLTKILYKNLFGLLRKKKNSNGNN